MKNKILNFDQFVNQNSEFDDDSDENFDDELILNPYLDSIDFDESNQYDAIKDFDYQDDDDIEDFDCEDENCEYLDCDNDDSFGDIENFDNDEFDLDDISFEWYYGLDEMSIERTNHIIERQDEREISDSIIDKVLDSCKMRLLKLKNSFKKILIRNKKENVSLVGIFQKIGRDSKFKLLTAINGLGLKYDENYVLINV